MQTGTRGNPSASILIVGESFGAEEAKRNEPFVGASGMELERMLAEAGINPADCYFTNVVNERPPNNEMFRFFYRTEEAKKLGLQPIRGLYPKLNVLEGLQKLDQLIEKLQPELIIGLGNYTLWALTEDSFKIGNSPTPNTGWKIPTGIGNYRGSQLRTLHSIPFMPTYHPAATFRNQPWRALAVHDFRMRARKILDGEPWDEPERNFIVRPSFDQVMEWIHGTISRATIASSPILLSCDIETSQKFLECIGLATSTTEAICIPIMAQERHEGYWSGWEEVEIFLALKQLLEHPNVEVLGQNFLYDFQYFFFHHFIRPNYRQDTMLGHHCVYPGTPMGLDHISSMYCDYHAYWKDDGKEASKNHDDLQRWIYNCRDVVVTYEAITVLWDLIQHYGLEMQYGIQMARARSAIDMMLRGVKLDRRRQGEEAKKQVAASMELANQLEEMLPVEIHPRPPKQTAWYRSPIQQATIFYDTLGIKPVRDKKTGNPTTKDDALDMIALREPMTAPIVKRLQNYRSLETFAQFINMSPSEDGRVRCTYSPTTETFRYRSSENAFGTGRNLQNIPVGNEED